MCPDLVEGHERARQAQRAFVATVGARWLSGSVAVLAMFPLNSVLFPYMPLRLRVFEERYLIMLAELLRNEDARFGVVLIERGREVGGGEECFSLGTIAEITQLGAQEGFVGLIAQGNRRFDSSSPSRPRPTGTQSTQSRRRSSTKRSPPARWENCWIPSRYFRLQVTRWELPVVCSKTGRRPAAFVRRAGAPAVLSGIRCRTITG